MRYAKRTDENHSEIREGLRAAGWEVWDLSAAGHGVPDLACRIQPGRSLFFEIKRADIKKKEQAMEPAQENWWYFNCSQTRIVQTLEQALDEARDAKERWKAPAPSSQRGDE